MGPDAPPAADSAIYDDLRTQLRELGPAKAIDALCIRLCEEREYGKLFYAMLMKKRFDMGVSPIPTGGAGEMTPKQQEEYEAAVREACRTVGKLFLETGNLPAAFEYLRMIGEPAAVAEALDSYSPGDEVDVQPVIEIAFHHGLNPKRGFDLVLDRYGICSAITFLSGGFSNNHTTEVRDHCIGRLVRSLHSQLLERLKAAVEQQQGFAPTAKTIPDLIDGRDWLFADEAYYTDTSHLSSVVQMSVDLTNEADLRLARELCAYGKKLSPNLQYPGHAPFDDTYADVDRYLGVLLGEDVPAGLEHFRAKITADPDGPDALSAAVLVKLLVRLDRKAEALEVAKEYLALEDERGLPCPGPFELATKLGDYEAFAATAQKRHDPVHFLAGLIARDSGGARSASKG
jgi:hypothetical protein